jgi:hypothetical protein
MAEILDPGDPPPEPWKPRNIILDPGDPPDPPWEPGGS